MTEPTHEERLARMARDADYPLTIVLINPINRALVRPLHGVGATPNQVTVMAFVVGVAASVALYFAAVGILEARVAAPLLVLIAHTFDALDGDLARYSNRKSKFGEMLDPALDRAREILYVAGASFGLWTAGVPEAALAGVCCVGATQLYYYTADAQIARVLGAKSNDARRYDVTMQGRGRTRVKFGLYEPFMYGLALGVAVGFGFEALIAFAVVFALMWVRQIFKLRRTVRAMEGAS